VCEHGQCRPVEVDRVSSGSRGIDHVCIVIVHTSFAQTPY
jgi:hypothetical protein